jgi:hypothetical protein
MISGCSSESCANHLALFTDPSCVHPQAARSIFGITYLIPGT